MRVIFLSIFLLLHNFGYCQILNKSSSEFEGANLIIIKNNYSIKHNYNSFKNHLLNLGYQIKEEAEGKDYISIGTVQKLVLGDYENAIPSTIRVQTMIERNRIYIWGYYDNGLGEGINWERSKNFDDYWDTWWNELVDIAKHYGINHNIIYAEAVLN